MVGGAPVDETTLAPPPPPDRAKRARRFAEGVDALLDDAARAGAVVAIWSTPYVSRLHGPDWWVDGWGRHRSDVHPDPVTDV